MLSDLPFIHLFRFNKEHFAKHAVSSHPPPFPLSSESVHHPMPFNFLRFAQKSSVLMRTSNLSRRSPTFITPHSRPTSHRCRFRTPYVNPCSQVHCQNVFLTSRPLPTVIPVANGAHPRFLTTDNDPYQVQPVPRHIIFVNIPSSELPAPDRVLPVHFAILFPVTFGDTEVTSRCPE